MNWKQLYTSSTEEERLEAVIHMLAAIEARQNKIIFTGNAILRNRRRLPRGYHMLGADQRGRHTIARAASIVSIWASLFAVSTATLLLALHAPPFITTQLLFFPATAILAIFAFKPKRQPIANRQQPTVKP